MAIRNGRFKGDAAAGIKIIDGKSGMFRIYNSGSIPFTVKPKNSPSSNVPVQPECSVDVEVTTTCTITAAGVVDGIYDFLGSAREIRSGRFKGDAATPVKIVSDSDHRLYRLLNSGDVDIEVEPSGTTLKPTFSLDISTGDDITIQGTGIECIYEQLRADSEIRSGRFKIRTVASGTYPHKIIDLKGGGGNGWYRIFNSGDETIQLLRGNTKFFDVAPDLSFDFEVQNSKDIFVQPANLTKTISGIYDYLGE